MISPFPANRLAVRRFLLDVQHLLSPPAPAAEPASPDEVLSMIRKLECVQLDPVAAVERNHHLVLAARIPGYLPETLNQLLQQRRIFEYWANAASILPMEDYPIVEGIRKRFKMRLQTELDRLEPVVRSVLARLEQEGPLPSRAFQSENRVHGYWDNQAPKTKATSHALNLLQDTGSIQVVRREGSERFFHLTRRAVPGDLLHRAETIGPEEADEALLEKYLRAYRVFDTGDPRFGWRRMTAADRRAQIARRVKEGSVVPLQIEGVRRPYFILAEDLDRLREHVRAAHGERAFREGPVRFLPPLDNLLWRRERVVDLFGFHYRWEIYLPSKKRRFGAYAMPILAGDRLIGRIDPRLDRERGRLIIRLLQLEPGVKLTSHLRKHLRDALESFARFHRAGEIEVQRTEPEGLEV